MNEKIVLEERVNKIDWKEWIPIIGFIQVFRNTLRRRYSLATCKENNKILYRCGTLYHRAFSELPILSGIGYAIYKLI